MPGPAAARSADFPERISPLRPLADLSSRVKSIPTKRVALTKLLGVSAGLIQGDFFTRDRWLWLKERLPETLNDEALLDVGCGTGAFSIAAAQRGYDCLGLSWDESDLAVATARAAICGAAKARFRVCDIRRLNSQEDLKGRFDFAICCENLEHVLEDRGLILAIHECLKPGGRLLLTTPNYHYKAVTRGDLGPFEKEELGWHVRRGYSRGQLLDLFHDSGFFVENISFCSGWFSQKGTRFLRIFDGKPFLIGWVLTLPIRYFLPPLDQVHARLFRHPGYSICVEAIKTKYGLGARARPASPLAP
jgi:SAM-dependent methyltransferase